MFPCYTQFITPCPSPTVSTSLFCLHLHCCHANRFICTLFVFIAEYVYIMYHNFFIHLSASGYLGCFHVLAIVKCEVTESCLTLTPWTVVYQAPPSMGFSRQKYRSRLPFPSLGDLPNPGIKPRFPALQVDPLPAEPPGKPSYYKQCCN